VNPGTRGLPSAARHLTIAHQKSRTQKFVPLPINPNSGDKKSQAGHKVRCRTVTAPDLCPCPYSCSCSCSSSHLAPRTSR